MKASVYKSDIKGKIKAPSSKSYTIRGLISAALAGGESEILDPLSSDDTEASQQVLTSVGVRISEDKGIWRVNGGEFREPTGDLFCRESAATLRFMTAISSVIPGQCRLTMAPSLAERPLMPLIEALRQLGADCAFQQGETCLTVNSQVLRGGLTELPGNISSQYVSALLFVSPLAENPVTIRLTTPLESRSFLLMTLECLKSFGIMVACSDDWREYRITPQAYRPLKYQVEADWSSASYLLALGALAGEIEVENLNPESLQGDRVILDLMKQMGASITTTRNSVRVKKIGLKAIKADLNDCIDLLPTVAVLAAAADGTSVFSGIDRARLKESDRVAAVRDGLEAMGIKVTEERDRISVTGSLARGAVINTRGDHRIAMAFSLLGSLVGDTVIDDAGCVSKTYPEFWDVLKSVGGEVKINE